MLLLQFSTSYVIIYFVINHIIPYLSLCPLPLSQKFCDWTTDADTLFSTSHLLLGGVCSHGLSYSSFLAADCGHLDASIRYIKGSSFSYHTDAHGSVLNVKLKVTGDVTHYRSPFVILIFLSRD